MFTQTLLYFAKLFSSKNVPEKPKWKEGSDKMLSKIALTDDVWKALHDKKDKWGYTFLQVINSGLEIPTSNIGCYAGSEDSYVTFAPFFDKIIEIYHGHKPDDKHKTDWDLSKIPKENLDPEGKYILSTRIRVARNLKDFPLGTQVNKAQRQEIEAKAKKAFESFTGELQGKYYSLEKLTKEEKKQLIEDHFLFKEGDRHLQSCGLERDWPEGRGIFHNNEKTFWVWVNEEDEFRLISMEPGGNVYAVFERLKKAQEAIEKVAKFAQNDHLGYISTCPTNLGTGMRASVHVKIPKLQKNQQKLKELALKYNLDLRGIHGEHSESEGGVHDVSNKRRLGFSEAQLANDMYNGVKALIEAEKSENDE